MNVGLVWFRRDLRIEDNPALFAAVAECDVVVCCFVLDPKILKSSDIGAPRVAYLLEALRLLKKNLADRGVTFVMRQGDVSQELQLLIQELSAKSLFFNRDYEPYATERDAEVAKMCDGMGVSARPFKEGMIHEPHEILKEDGTPYAVYSPYRRVWEKKGVSKPLAKPEFKNRSTPEISAVKPGEIPELKELGFHLDVPMIPVGEQVAQDALTAFLAGPAPKYETERNFAALEGTSRLSAHLRFGTISARTVAHRAQEMKRKVGPTEAGRSLDVFVSEIIWRDFYRSVLWHNPHVATSCFKPEYNALKWENDEKRFQAWCEGKTGYPMVDAGMRQLNTTGWMHNRVRMVVAAFLTKDLLVSWQWGEKYFMQKLFDGDLAANNGGWQWSAGTGTDAQPYFRIFNPKAQAEKFDPEGKYVRKYVLDRDELSYPQPIVDHAVQRDKALALFKAVAKPESTGH